MSDTCIVCLGDLTSGNGEVPAISTTLAKSPAQDDLSPPSEVTDAYNTITSTVEGKESSELIAHLQPCGHDLHNECLTPWVERANSCPICRASFHLVELLDRVGGTVISSYAVQDRTQVAELDPSMFLEVPDEEDEDQPCQACGEDDNEDVLMYCDGCQKMWHTYCVGLQEVPYGHWFCDNCRAQRDIDPRQQITGRSTRSSRRRTRGQQRRQRGHQNAHDQSWNQVWQSVWSRINLDLDFPYEDDEMTATYIRRHRQRSNGNNRVAHDAWLRRMQVAELHGAGNRFRETEPALVNSPGGQSTPTIRNARASPLPRAQDPEEALAWDAFDQARAASDEPTNSRKKKRKSRTSSPTEADSEPAPIVVKRRRTSQPAVPATTESRASISRPRPQSRPLSPIPRRQPVSDNAAPSFLQSLLQEVEDSSNSSNHIVNMHRPSPRIGGCPPAEQHSPRPSSPALSPLPSNHSSPRAMSTTPPPPGSLRPNSPTGLSSSIQPVFPSTEYSPLRSRSPEPKDTINGEISTSRSIPPRSSSASLPQIAQPRPHARLPRILDQASSPPPMISSNDDTSPTRAAMSLTAKSDVQRLVSAALKPHYNEQKISKDEYTAINRDISRMLYDRIGDFEALEADDKAKWEKVAGDEVTKAVGALKAQA